MADPVELTDLDVIARYSIAVRAATVERDELVATLRGDLEWLEAGRPARRSTTGRAPRKQVAKKPAKQAARKAAPKPASGDASDSGDH